MNMATPNRDRKRILLVEDHIDNSELVELSLAEYTVICAHDFKEGMRLARQRYFDLYILDNWLPDRSGVELCRTIRRFDPHTPILFCSAATFAHDIREAMRAGAQKYLVKPVFPDELRQAVTQLISVARENVFEARIAELAAVREELAI